MNAEHDRDEAAALQEEVADETLRTRDRLLEDARADAEEIRRAAMQQAETLQAELLHELEAEVRHRLSLLDLEIAERREAAEREAAGSIERAEATAAQLLLKAHRDGKQLRDELVAAVKTEVEALRRQQLSDAGSAGLELLDQARKAAADRLEGADAVIAARRAEAEHAHKATLRQATEQAAATLAEAQQLARQRLLDAEEASAQRLLEATDEAREIVEQARAQATQLQAPPIDLRTPEEAGDLRDGEESTTSDRSGGRRLARATRVLGLVVAALVASAVLQSYVAESYTVASTSMEPELHEGDRLVVNKVAYRFGDIQRGDIVVLDPGRLSGAASDLPDTLVKRVIGLPGETVEAADGVVRIDGVELDEPWLDGIETPSFAPVLVPADHLFVLGDDRILSLDSRAFGVVPMDAVIGRVEAIVWPPGRAGRV